MTFEINNVLLVEMIPSTLMFTHYEWTARYITVNVKRKLDQNESESNVILIH